MVTRQYRRPYLRSPYIREQLEQPKQQLADAVELIEDLLDGVGGAWFALRQLTEEAPDQPDIVRKVQAQMPTDSESDVEPS